MMLLPLLSIALYSFVLFPQRNKVQGLLVDLLKPKEEVEICYSKIKTYKQNSTVIKTKFFKLFCGFLKLICEQLVG